jgi:Restriction endonuclease
MKKRKQNKHSKSQQNWRLVEQIVAAVFEAADVRVQRNVWLHSVRRRGGRGGMREIDVLITGRLAGQTIYIPVECKHHNKKTDSPEIDAFIGKLLDVGLPTQTSIFVATVGFTQPAIERAQEVGMRTLVLSGAEFSQVREKVLEAIQSHVFMTCSLTQLSFQTDELLEAGSIQHILFYDAAGSYKGSIADLLWEAWLNGAPLLVCGCHVYSVQIPEDWRYLADGRRNSIHNIQVEYQVAALAFQFRGVAKEYNLMDALTRVPERQTLQVRFSTNPIDAAPRVFETEAALNEFLSAPGHARVTIGRIRLPKLIMNKGMLWPIPSTVIEHFNRFRSDQPEQDLERLAASASNNFWDFDEAYAQVLKKARLGLSIRMQVQAS